MTIFLVTTVEKIKEEPTTKLQTFGDRRCVGFFETIEDAMIAVSERLKDKFYRYCIIEEVKDGLFKRSDNRYIFEWSSKERRYIQIDEPRLIHMVTNFAIG